LNLVGWELKRKSIDWSTDFAMKRGVTSVHAMEYLDDIETLRDTLENQPVRVELYARSDDLSRILALGLKSIGSDILLDGTFGCHTAAISDPYEDNQSESGILYYAGSLTSSSN